MDWIVSTTQSIYCVLFVFPQRWRDGDRVFHRHSNLNICNFIVVYNNIRMDSKYVPSTILGIKDLSIRSSLHFFFLLTSFFMILDGRAECLDVGTTSTHVTISSLHSQFVMWRLVGPLHRINSIRFRDLFIFFSPQCFCLLI